MSENAELLAELRDGAKHFGNIGGMGFDPDVAAGFTRAADALDAAESEAK